MTTSKPRRVGAGVIFSDTAYGQLLHGPGSGGLNPSEVVVTPKTARTTLTKRPTTRSSGPSFSRGAAIADDARTTMRRTEEARYPSFLM